MRYPLPVSLFERYVPHRAPMVWVDEVLSASASEGECRVKIDPSALYMSEGAIHPMSCVEWIAQGFAYVRAAYFMEIGYGEQGRALEAYLVAVRDAEFMFEPDDLREIQELIVRVHSFREFGTLIMLTGEVKLPSGRVLMRAGLRVFHKQAGAPSAAN
jgi:predicted hotdog family 3-hydroxylacyl-ACP dehydratase